MKNKLTSVLFILPVILGLLFFFPKENAYARYSSTYMTIVYLCSKNSGTNWEVQASYREADGTYQVYKKYYFTNVSSSGGAACPSGTVRIGSFSIANWIPDAGDDIIWLTACADPIVPANVTGFSNNLIFYVGVDVGCHSMNYNGTGDCAYAACDRIMDIGYSGTIYFDSICPSYQYCSTRGTIWGASCNNVYKCTDYCGGTNNCTWYNRSCTTTPGCVVSSTTAYSTRCGGNTISGTNICGSYSYTCSPPPPDFTLSTSCSGGTASIAVNRTTSVSHSSGDYDLRWKKTSASSWSSDCTPTDPQTITGLASSTQYQVGYRGNTTAGYNGPTDFRTRTITTGDCDAPDLNITAFSFPGGYAGDSGIASVTVRNIGYSTASNFAVTVRDGVTATVWTQNISSLTAGASTTLNYSITKPLTAGTYTAVATADSNNTVVELNESNNTATSTYTIIPNTITANVYQDFNGNGLQDCANPLVTNYPTCTGSTPEPGYPGGTLYLSGPTSLPPGTTDANGQYIFNNLNVGDYYVTLNPIPSGYVLKNPPAQPATATVPPPATINFAIQPPTPTCGNLTAAPTSRHPGEISTVSITCSTSAPGSTITYTWDTTIGSVSPTTSTGASGAQVGSTFTAPNPFWKQIPANVSVEACITGTTRCTTKGTQIQIVPLFSISGSVFVDQNKNKQIDAGELPYAGDVTGDINISPNPIGATITAPSTGTYTINNLPSGTYTVTYTKPIALANWIMTYPLGTPPTFTVNVGNTTTSTPCNIYGNLNAKCDNVVTPPPADPSDRGNIITLGFGISNSIPWIQSVGGDITGVGVTDPNKGSLKNLIPPTAIEPYVSVSQSWGGSPGIIYLGNSDYLASDFGSGQASRFQSGTTPPWNWTIAKDLYNVRNSQIKTSYQSVASLARQSNITPTPLTNAQCGPGGLSNCNLGTTTLTHGIYIANGDLTLGNGASGSTYTFPSGNDYVILVNGNLNIKQEIHVPSNPGSTALFTASGDINVDSSVGTADFVTKTATQVEGYYSTDGNFSALGNSSCPATDKKLNVGGAIVVNAALRDKNLGLPAGVFNNSRDLCAQDLYYPSFSIIERPDFILNAPDLFKVQKRIWQEVAP